MLDDPHAALNDGGCQPACVVEAGRFEGALSEQAFPFSEDPVLLNRRVSFRELENARNYRIADIAVIEETGDAGVQVIRNALAAGFPIGFGMEVDQSYEALGPNDIYEGPNGPALGGHSQAVVGYVGGVFIVAGSWGAGFANGGFAKIAPSFFARPGATYDRYIAHVVPCVPRAA
jgi:hypothetical protein